MNSGTLKIFASLIDLISAHELCEYFIIDLKNPEYYTITSTSNALSTYLSVGNINSILTRNSLNQLANINSSSTNEIWKVEFVHEKLSFYKGIKYFWGQDQILILLTKEPGWNFLNSLVFEKFLNHVNAFCLCINLNDFSIDYVSDSINNILGYNSIHLKKKPWNCYIGLFEKNNLDEFQNTIKPNKLYKDFTPFTNQFNINDFTQKHHIIKQHTIFIGIDNRYTGLFFYALESDEHLNENNSEKYIGYLDYLLELTKQSIWEFDISEKKLKYDLQLQNIFIGQKFSIALSEKDFYGNIHPDDKERVANEFNSFLSSESEKVSLLFKYLSQNKEWRWIEIKAKKIYYQNKEPQKILGIFSDVTENIEKENSNNQKTKELDEVYLKLKTNEEIFRQLVENTNDVFMLRDENNYIYVNSQFEKIWGRDIFDLLENPQNMQEWIHPEDTDKIDVWVDFNQFVSDKSLIEQYRIIKPDKSIRWIWTRTYPVFNESKKLYRIVSISTDITDQKEFENALLKAKEKALESDMLKTNFLANISHEIRTPMNGIIGFAELLARDDLDSAIRKNYVAIMKKSSEQLIRIIDDIIDFAKIESNQIRLSLVNFNLNKLINELKIVFTNQLESCDKIRISLVDSKSLSDEDAFVISDDFRIRQILSNLLDNAVKFTKEGEIRFGYEIKEDKIEFFVKDTGIGLSPDKHELIFERFRQADEGHTRKYGGTGLGLPISKGLVNILGGSIWIESILNKGSSFYFTVPYVIQDEIKDNNLANKLSSLKYNWKDKIILIAEDDDMNFEYLRVILESTEAKIIRAVDGSQAIKMCSKFNFDVILMDIRLPVLNGIEATRHIRDLGIKTPIIAQTAYAMNDDVKNCIEAGCNRYIAKPISKEALFKLIDSVLL